MQIGNLIRTTRRIAGVPVGSLALIIKVEEPSTEIIELAFTHGDCRVGSNLVHTVQFIGGTTSGRPTRRMLARDLEVISG